jgi:hypothetical protein
MPDLLFRRAKTVMVKRGMTFRSLVIDALEQALNESRSNAFVLREAAAGYTLKKPGGVSRRAINDAIDESREPRCTS